MCIGIIRSTPANYLKVARSQRRTVSSVHRSVQEAGSSKTQPCANKQWGFCAGALETLKTSSSLYHLRCAQRTSTQEASGKATWAREIPGPRSRLRDLELSLFCFCCDQEVFWDLHVTGKQHAVSVLGRLESDPDTTACNSSCERHQHPVHRTTRVRTQWLRNRSGCWTNRCCLRCNCWSFRDHCGALLSGRCGLSLWLYLRLAHWLCLSRWNRCRTGSRRWACRNCSYRLRLGPGHVALLRNYWLHRGHWCWRCRRHWSWSSGGWRHGGHWCRWNRCHWWCCGWWCGWCCYGCASTRTSDRTVPLSECGRRVDDADGGRDDQRQERLLHD